MFDSQVTFYKDDPFRHRTHNPFSKSNVQAHSDHPVHCFISAKEHQINFHQTPDTHEPFYKLNPPSISAKIDPSTNSLTITQKGKEQILVKISTTKNNIAQIQDFCTENSDESKLWEPLYYTPCSQARDSFLSLPHTESRFHGLLNFTLVTAVFARFRDLLSNLSTYGIRPPQAVTIPTGAQLIYGLLCFAISTVLMYIFEKLAYKGWLSKRVVNTLETLNMLGALAFPVFFSLYFKPNPLFAMAYLAWSAMMMLKMTSYMLIMNEVRKVLPQVRAEAEANGHSSNKKANQPELKISRENLEVIKKSLKNTSDLVTVKNIMYFYFAPTLNYQIWYPRTSTIRWPWLGKMVIQLILCWSFFLFWANQFVIPVMNQSGEVFRHGSFTEKLGLVIDVGNNYSMILPAFFYGLFHLLTNVLAELLTFADRDFYRDFWNCRSFGQFWANWNFPVHKWIKRHIYYPMLKKGYSKNFGIFAVFLFSGIAHEYIYSLPLRIFSVYSIVMLLLQAPIALVERRYDTFLRNSQVGNLLFWAFFWFLITPYGLCHYYSTYLYDNGWVK